MSRPPGDPTVARVHQALQESLHAGEFDGLSGMVVGWVLSGTFVDQDGERRMILIAADQQGIDVTVGQIRVAELVWSERVRRWHGTDDQ